jgi:hypothetical protein
MVVPQSQALRFDQGRLKVAAEKAIFMLFD